MKAQEALNELYSLLSTPRTEVPPGWYSMRQLCDGLGKKMGAVRGLLARQPAGMVEQQRVHLGNCGSYTLFYRFKDPRIQRLLEKVLTQTPSSSYPEAHGRTSDTSLGPRRHGRNRRNGNRNRAS